MSQAVAVKPLAEPIPAEEGLSVLGESTYDKVTSFLMAVVLGAIMVVGWLALVYISNQAYASRVTSPLQIIEVGGGGGSHDGTSGSTEKVDVAGADVAAAASNNQEEAGDFEEPSVEQTPGAMMDTVSEAGQSLAEVDLGATMPTGGQVASGKRASKLGTGGPGLGFGPGDGGVAREQRWSIIYSPGQTDHRSVCPAARRPRCRAGRRRQPGTALVHFSLFQSDAYQAAWRRAQRSPPLFPLARAGP